MQNLKKYQGMWVAIHKNKVIVSGKNAISVHEKAKKMCKIQQ